MPHIIKDKDLKALNTFGVSSIAKEFVQVNSEAELLEVLDSKLPIYPLGGGSNLLLPEVMNYRVIHNVIDGLDIIDESEETVVLRVGGGMNWHELVTQSVENGWGGIENLALIPGTVGAAPIQNIGAYGVELKDVFVHLEAIEIQTGHKHVFTKADCQFGYRDSIFKNSVRGQFFITYVILKLVKSEYYTTNAEYRSLKDYLVGKELVAPSIQDVFHSVIEIRQSKLPDPQVIGNSGSFFKNAIISIYQLESIQRDYPDVVFYPVDENTVKVPTGWLIERAGWKGRKIGNVGCYEKQALVLVNHGGGTSTEIHDLSNQIIRDVKIKFDIDIVPEVNVL